MTRTIAEIRAEQEAAKDRWSSTVREAIINVLRRTGQFHADDLASLGIPDEHRNIIGSQVARLVNQKWIVECGRRKSAIPSRNGAKSNVYRLTKAGVVGVGAGTASKEGAKAFGLTGAVSTASADPGDGSPAVSCHAAAGEPARLFDAGVGNARPLNPLVDQEAA